MSKKLSIKPILIVEDDVTLLKALVLSFEKSGLPTIQAVTAEDGLEIATKEHPSLILLDIRLPKMDGLSMLKKLREDKWGADAPVILLTNMNTPDHVAKATEYKAFDYLVKSDWRLDDVIGKVKQRLRIK